MKWLLTVFWLSFMLISPAGGQSVEVDTTLAGREDLQVIKTRRGDMLFGHTVMITDQHIIFRPRRLSPLTFQRAEVVWLGLVENAYWLEGTIREANRNYQSYAPDLNWWEENLAYSMTAFPYPKGEAEYRNISILYNVMDVGLSENLSLGGGIVIPFLFVLRSKLSFGISEYWHMGAGLNNFIGLTPDSEGFISHLYLNSTFGNPRQYFNLTAGRAWDWGFPEDSPFLISLGGGIAFADNWKIYTDVGFSPGNEGFVPTMLLSWFKKRNRLEIGVLGIPEAFPSIFPLVGYAHRF